jgi:hypothetical protein
MPSPSSTTAQLSAEPPGPVARNVQRFGLLVLCLVVVAAAAGLLGPREGRVADRTGDYALVVDHPAITRAGQPAPLHIKVHQQGGFDGPITLALSRDLFDDSDFQTWYPTPSAETAEPERIIYEFDAPPGGEDFEVHLDARTAPGQFGEISRNTVTLLVDDEPAVQVDFRVWRMP